MLRGGLGDGVRSPCTIVAAHEVIHSAVNPDRAGCESGEDARMSTTIDVSLARELLLTRDDLIIAGHTDREISSRVAAKQLIRLRPGRYVEASAWKELWAEGRHLLQVLAVHRNSDAPGPVFWGPSAAVLHGLPLYRLAPQKVHTVILGERHGRSRARVMWHNVGITDADIVEIDGIRCTSMDRTVLDLACSSHPEAGLACADAAMRRETVTGHVQDEAQAGEWRDRMLDRAERLHTRGIREARRLIEFTDGRAQLPGESVSRLQLHRLGYRHYELQVHIVGPDGENYWLDFGFPRSHAYGEFDGQGKYLDPALRGQLSAEEVVLAEKKREDAVRGVTGWRGARWGSEHIRTPDTFLKRLLAFNIRPPG